METLPVILLVLLARGNKCKNCGALLRVARHLKVPVPLQVARSAGNFLVMGVCCWLCLLEKSQQDCWCTPHNYAKQMEVSCNNALEEKPRLPPQNTTWPTWKCS